MDWQKYNKFWAALSAAIVVLLACAASTDLEPAWHFTGDEIVAIVAAFVGSLGVYQVSNKKAE